MKISVIIPARDLEGRIAQCLDSVAAQDFSKEEYEVLIVLDSCTDNTNLVVSAWKTAHADVDVKIFYAQCGTPGGARNVGLDNASGEYILFVDGDDYLCNASAMSLLYSAVQGHNAVRVTDHERSGTHTKFTERLTLWLHFFSRALIGGERMTNLLINEDYEFVRRIRAKAGYDETTLDVPLYYYNFDEARMLQKIIDARRETRQRRAQGLPPVYKSEAEIEAEYAASEAET